MKADVLGQVYGKGFARPPRWTNPQSGAFRISSAIGANLGRQAVQFSGIGKQFQQIVGAGNPRLRSRFDSFAKILDGLQPSLFDYRRAQRRASRRHGWIADLELPGEAGIGDLTAALNALTVGGDQALLKRLHRRLRRQARNGDQQAAALADWLDLVRELLADEEFQRILRAIRAHVDVLKLIEFAEVRTAARTQRRRRSARHEHNPVRGRRCPRAPATSSVLPCPEVAA